MCRESPDTLHVWQKCAGQVKMMSPDPPRLPLTHSITQCHTNASSPISALYKHICVSAGPQLWVFMPKQTHKGEHAGISRHSSLPLGELESFTVNFKSFMMGMNGGGRTSSSGTQTAAGCPAGTGGGRSGRSWAGGT